MIASLRGTLIAKSPTEVLLEVNGVGYLVAIPLSTHERLGPVRSELTLLTYLHVREDALQLFGFATEEERSLFRLLISVTGIGPRVALGILSGIPVTELRQHIAQGNLGAMTGIPGVGRKLAERLIVELRDKIGGTVPGAETAPNAGGSAQTIRSEALLALTSLGYQRAAAEKAIRTAAAESEGDELTVEGLIKRALRHTASK
jgi:Holliday junction DNA helicase RuvA